MNNEIVNAMEELENWLADPSELGRKPAKIEYTASFEDEDGIKCMIFKFKKSFFGKWLLGIVSESGTFSEMKEYNSSTETEDAKALLHILKEYWKKMAEKGPKKFSRFMRHFPTTHVPLKNHALGLFISSLSFPFIISH